METQASDAEVTAEVRDRDASAVGEVPTILAQRRGLLSRDAGPAPLQLRRMRGEMRTSKGKPKWLRTLIKVAVAALVVALAWFLGWGPFERDSMRKEREWRERWNAAPVSDGVVWE